MSNLRMLIVDDHPVIVEGLLLFLGEYPDIQVVSTALNCQEGLEKLHQCNPDVVVMDLMLPEIDGFDAIRLFLQQEPEVPIVVYSGLKDDLSVNQALEAGARGYVLKGDPVSQLVDAVRVVRSGGYWLSPKLKQTLIASILKGDWQERGRPHGLENLSVREQEVFWLLAKGKSTTEVGNILFISPKTVGKHRVAIKTKLKLKNVAEMANYAMRINPQKVDKQNPE
jgi:two-component system, NarL family, response regulator NreC